MCDCLFVNLLFDELVKGRCYRMMELFSVVATVSTVDCKVLLDYNTNTCVSVVSKQIEEREERV